MDIRCKKYIIPMKKKKRTAKSVIIYNSNRIKVIEEINNDLIFDIDNETTIDLAEAISMILHINIDEPDFWNITYKTNIINITSHKTIYWLTGGDKEWTNNQNYIYTWSDVYNIYQEKYNDVIINIIKSSETFLEIKNKFLSELNFLTLYEFGLKNRIIKL